MLKIKKVRNLLKLGYAEVSAIYNDKSKEEVEAEAQRFIKCGFNAKVVSNKLGSEFVLTITKGSN